MDQTVVQSQNSTDNWKVQPARPTEKNKYSEDDLIEAYFKGVSDQKDKQQKALINIFNSNLEKAKELSIEILEYIDKKNYTCKQVLLRAKDIFTFTSFFVIDESDYINDKFLEVYSKSIKIKKRVNKPGDFDYSVIFSPSHDELSKDCLLADGYILSLEE